MLLIAFIRFAWPWCSKVLARFVLQSTSHVGRPLRQCLFAPRKHDLYGSQEEFARATRERRMRRLESFLTSLERSSRSLAECPWHPLTQPHINGCFHAHGGRWGGNTFPPADEDEFRRHIRSRHMEKTAKTNSPNSNSPPLRRENAPMNSKDEFPPKTLCDDSPKPNSSRRRIAKSKSETATGPFPQTLCI